MCFRLFHRNCSVPASEGEGVSGKQFESIHLFYVSAIYVRDCISCTSSVAVGNKKTQPNREKEEKQKWLKPHTSRKNNNQELCLRQNSIITHRKSRLLLLFFFLFHLENTKHNFHSMIPEIQKEIERETGFAHPILFHL